MPNTPLMTLLDELVVDFDLRSQVIANFEDVMKKYGLNLHEQEFVKTRLDRAVNSNNVVATAGGMSRYANSLPGIADEISVEPHDRELMPLTNGDYYVRPVTVVTNTTTVNTVTVTTTTTTTTGTPTPTPGVRGHSTSNKDFADLASIRHRIESTSGQERSEAVMALAHLIAEV